MCGEEHGGSGRDRTPADGRSPPAPMVQPCGPSDRRSRSLPRSPQIRATPGGGSVRLLAFDGTLPASEALGRIRDAFADYDNA